MNKHVGKILISIYIILLASVFLNAAFSKNASKITGNGEIDVAGMKLNIIKTTDTVTNVSNTERNIYFTINNFDGTKENPIYNDVEYTYKISITNKNINIPLEYTLYKIENGIETQIEVKNGLSTSFTMKKSAIQEDKFVLKVKMTDKSHKNLSGLIDIGVFAEQSNK